MLMLKVLSSIFFIRTIQGKLKLNTKYAINVGIICQIPKCKVVERLPDYQNKIVTFDFVKFKIKIV